MADKPSRGLVLYGDGLMRFVSPSHTHLHQLASRGTCGFLSLPHSPPAESEDERVVRELAQLLDAYESYITRSGKQSSSLENLGKSSGITISERFMGLRAAIFTSDPSVRSFAEFLGFTALQFDELIMNNQSSREPPAYGLLKLLGFQDGKAYETSEYDLVFVHIGPDGRYNEVDLVNGLVGGILQICQLGSDISSRLHFSVVMSYGTLAENDDSLLNFSLQQETNPDLSLLLPRQSYTITGKDSVDSIRHHCPMLITQLQDAVTRKDMAEIFSFKDFKERCLGREALTKKAKTIPEWRFMPTDEESVSVLHEKIVEERDLSTCIVEVDLCDSSAPTPSQLFDGVSEKDLYFFTLIKKFEEVKKEFLWFLGGKERESNKTRMRFPLMRNLLDGRSQ